RGPPAWLACGRQGLFKSAVDLVGCYRISHGGGTSGGRTRRRTCLAAQHRLRGEALPPRGGAGGSSPAVRRCPCSSRKPGECWNTQFVSLRQSGTFHPRKSGIPLTLRRENGQRSSQNKIVVRGALPHRCWIGSAAGGWLVVRAIVFLSVQDDRR